MHPRVHGGGILMCYRSSMICMAEVLRGYLRRRCWGSSLSARLRWGYKATHRSVSLSAWCKGRKNMLRKVIVDVEWNFYDFDIFSFSHARPRPRVNLGRGLIYSTYSLPLFSYIMQSGQFVSHGFTVHCVLTTCFVLMLFNYLWLHWKNFPHFFI